MTVNTYLGQLKNIDKRIKDKIQEAEKWREIAKNPKIVISEIRVQTSAKPDKIGDAIALAVTYEAESEELAKELTELKHTIINQIDNIGDEYCYNVLKGYYINGMNYTELASSEKRTYKQIKNMYAKALGVFDAKYGEVYKDKKPIIYAK